MMQPGEEKKVIGHYRDFKNKDRRQIIPAGSLRPRSYVTLEVPGCPATARGGCWNCRALNKRQGKERLYR